MFRQRIEREEREELRKKNIPNWKEKTFMPDELAGRLEQDRRNFQMRTLEVCVWVWVQAHVCFSVQCTVPMNDLRIFRAVHGKDDGRKVQTGARVCRPSPAVHELPAWVSPALKAHNIRWSTVL